VTNPVTKYELQDFSLEFDIGKLMENFFNLRSLGGNTTEYGPFTFDDPFATGVVPVVQCTLGSLNASRPAAMAGGIITAFDIDETGCKVAVFNSTGTTFGSGIIGMVTAIDPTYDTSV
jgi:hypothetical protein